ncbi:L-threonylcarbamoyladenylate synthase [Thalassotalea sp. PLHSN55]|uniref:L-threonylcarbamoyladenylate synthase n=1 Tax=Thalassotalea sp. PLHSN55 TaxID=3435888 RepID=UPI003F824DFC
MSYSSAQQAFEQGGVIAYPTEAVFGLGCDPDNADAVQKLLTIKSRPQDKGLILLASDYQQLRPYIDDEILSDQQRQQILSRWPNGITQVLPANKNTPVFLTGKFSSIAVRLTTQPDVVALCESTNKPIVSTSANISGQAPAITWQQAQQTLGALVDYIVKGETLGFEKPSTIIDGLTGQVFR